jgi:hypothetical protein
MTMQGSLSPAADIPAGLALGSNVPIVLQKSFCTVDRKFFEL